MTRTAPAEDRRYGTMPSVGVGSLVIRDGAVLMVKRGKAPSYGLWSVPGGGLRYGETLRQAAEREVKEETGVNVMAGDVIGVYDLMEYDEHGQIEYHYVLVDLEATYISGETAPSSDALEARWIPFHELPQLNIPDHLRTLLSEVLVSPDMDNS